MDQSKLYYFPESFNQLRAELYNFHPRIWKKVAWAMAFDQLLFVEMMNKELDLRVLFETDLDGVCKLYLQTLKNKRGPDAIIN